MSNADNTPGRPVNRCIRCGRELPPGASFCPFCETEQVESVTLQAPPRKRRLFLALSLAAAVVVVCLCVLWYNHKPRTYRGEKNSAVRYQMGSRSLDVMATFDTGSIDEGRAISVFEEIAAEGDQCAHPLWLCAYSSDDPSCVEAFAEQIESVSIEAVPADARSGETEGESEHPSSPMKIYGPNRVEDPSVPALWKADLLYSSENGTNVLNWTITMKNKDRILLTQTMTCRPMPAVDLYYQDTPLETVDDIKAAAASVSRDTILNLYLPPVTYTEPLDLSDRCVNLYGTSDLNRATTFAAQITVPNRQPQLMVLSDLTFAGDGGCGLLAKEGVLLTRCVFTGWEVAVDAVDGSWPVIDSCVFEGNHIGLRFNSASATTSNDGCYATVFRDNDVAAYLIRVPGDLEFNFPDCTFEGNKEDVKRD